MNGRATVIRGVLNLQSEIVLLAVDGRKVMDLRPGANDVSRLSPGVYFVRSVPSAGSRKPSAITKIVIAR